MEYSLRPSEPQDKAWLESLRRDVYKGLFDLTWGGWDEERHQRHFSAFWERGHIQIIEVDGSPIGVLQLFEAGDEIDIGEIQISPVYQGQGLGLGTKVLSDVINRAKTDSKNITLSTGLKNEGAVRLYQKLGFTETRRSDTHIHMVYVTKSLS